MTTAPAVERVHVVAVNGHSPTVSPIDPRLRLLLIALRHALLILADALADYCGLEKRG